MIRFPRYDFLCVLLGVGEAQSFPSPLSPEEETELFKKKEEGDEGARNKLIEHNLRLVAHIVRKYYISYQNSDELISIGSLGLVKAIDSFKIKNGTRFATYAAKCIQNEILMYFSSQRKCSCEVSINETIDIDKDGNPLTYSDIISVDDTIAEDLDMKIHSEKAIELIKNVLDERERMVIVLRYGLISEKALTQKEVARKLKISRSYVSRIEKKALEKLRENFKVGDIFN